MKKIILIIVGIISLICGIIGSILPILPTVPFLLLAAFCFGKSSQKLEQWFCSTKIYRNHLESYTKGEGMTVKTKVRIVITVTLLMGIGFLAMKEVLIGRIILSIIWGAHMIYFLLVVRTNKGVSYD